jgi:hypothetical protein
VPDPVFIEAVSPQVKSLADAALEVLHEYLVIGLRHVAPAAASETPGKGSFLEADDAFA